MHRRIRPPSPRCPPTSGWPPRPSRSRSRRRDMTKQKVRTGFADQLETREVEIAAGDPAPWDPSQKFSILGSRVPRLDGSAKVSGQARYSVDMRRQGMLYGGILRSPYPAAVVKEIDLAAARKMPGVRAVLAIAKP